MSSPQEELPCAVVMPWRSFISVSVLGLCSEFSWAVQEATVIPHLTKVRHTSVWVCLRLQRPRAGAAMLGNEKNFRRICHVQGGRVWGLVDVFTPCCSRWGF